MPDEIKIEVRDPATGNTVSWRAMGRDSAIRQAKIEAERGAVVYVTKNGNRIIWTNDPKA